MELKMPPEEVAVVDYFARRDGVSRSEWIREAVKLAMQADFRHLAHDDPGEHRRVVDAIKTGRLDSL